MCKNGHRVTYIVHSQESLFKVHFSLNVSFRISPRNRNCLSLLMCDTDEWDVHACVDAIFGLRKPHHQPFHFKLSFAISLFFSKMRLKSAGDSPSQGEIQKGKDRGGGLELSL